MEGGNSGIGGRGATHLSQVLVEGGKGELSQVLGRGGGGIQLGTIGE